jgi:hypothetical protein
MVSFDIILVASKRASFDRLEPIIFRGINGIDEITINDVVTEWNVHLKINDTHAQAIFGKNSRIWQYLGLGI